MENCIFCKIINKEISAEVVFENTNWLAFLDIKPINLGHTLLVPKAHYQDLFDLSENLLSEVGGLIQKLGRAVKDAANADGFNLGMNNSPAAGQLVNHAHFHLIPRFDGDGFEHWRGKSDIPKEKFTEIASKIQSLEASP